MNLNEFITKYNGKGIDHDNSFGYQCMDLAHKYAIEVIGQDIPSAPAAKDVWNKTTTGYDKIKNTPEGLPQKGDIIIWGTEVGPYGHIAVFLEGNLTTFTSFDQNFPINSLCHKQLHSYGITSQGVLGWLHPKTTLNDNINIPKTNFEELVVKSNQWDKVSDFLAVDKLDNQGGDKVIERIKEFRRSIAEKESELEATRKARDEALLNVCPNPSDHTTDNSGDSQLPISDNSNFNNSTIGNPQTSGQENAIKAFILSFIETITKWWKNL